NYLLGDALPDTEYPQDVPLGEAFAVARIARERLERLVASQIDLHRQLGGRADAVTPVVVSSRAVMVDDLDRTRHVLRTDWGGNAVRKLGWLPLAALVLSLFPFAATLIASLRARARQIGVLRGCGLSRGGLLRLCIGESL